MKITTKTEALNIVETSYLASLSSLLWVALYYLPIGGALLRLILPLPIIPPEHDCKKIKKINKKNSFFFKIIFFLTFLFPGSFFITNLCFF